MPSIPTFASRTPTPASTDADTQPHGRARWLPTSVTLPQAENLLPASQRGRPVLGLPIEHSPRRIAYRAALRDFLEVIVDEATESPGLLAGRADRVRSHYEGMFRVTLHGLLLAADQRACGTLLLDNARAVADMLPDLVADRTGLSREEVLLNPDVYSMASGYAGEIWHWAGEVAGEVARESVEAEVAVFPHLLTLLRDNVLIYCRRSTPQITDLAGYIEAMWGVPGDELLAAMGEAEQSIRDAWDAVPTWARREFGVDGSEFGQLSRRWPGLVARFSASGEEGAPDPHQAAVWEQLLQRRQQFERLAALCDQVIAVERVEGIWTRSGDSGAEPVRFAPDLRPMSLFSAQGTGSTVQRFGLRYDITNFSSTMAGLELMPGDEREAALRRFFFFQRRVQNAARRHGLRLEKYFGDGLLFSSTQSARAVLAAAVEIQRAYRHAVDRGMVFAGGIRLAANWGAYRVVAQVGDSDGQPAGRAEGQLFGPGIVEISRLVGGKVSRDLSEIKKLLTGAGYRREEVQRFFARFEQRNIRLVDETAESRRFWAYVNPNGTLVNEGIVVTASFVGRLLAAIDGDLGRHREGGREFLLINLADRRDPPLIAGLTHRGFAEFKGLAPIEVFEVVDAREWSDEVDENAGFEKSVDLRQMSWLPEPVYD